MTVRVLLGVYVAAAVITAAVVAADRPWRVSPPRHVPRRKIALGLVVNGLLWPLLIVRAVRRGW